MTPGGSVSRNTILEVGDDPAVGFAGHLLAGFGHRVIKLEFLPHGDAARYSPPFYKSDARERPAGVLFHYLNQGKESVAIDPADTRARALAQRLSAAVGAVIVGVDPSADKSVAELISELTAKVMTAVSPFGQNGPHAHHSATAGTIFASAGEASMLPGGLGFELNPDAPPLLAPGHVADFDAGVIAALVTLSGLFKAQAVEHALTFDVSKQECETSLNRWLVSHYCASGWVESRATRAYAYGGLVECRDGYVMLQPTTDGHWTGLRRMLGDPEWADDQSLSTQEGRVASGQLIQEHCREWAAGRTKVEIFEAGLECGVPVAPFRDMSEVTACAQFAGRNFFVPYGPLRLPGLPFGDVFPDAPIDAVAPDLGQDTENIVDELLGSGERLAVEEAPR